MSDLYIVTTENVEDGMWFDDPEGFDSLDQATKHAETQNPKKGICFGVYSCRLVKTYGDDVQ